MRMNMNEYDDGFYEVVVGERMKEGMERRNGKEGKIKEGMERKE